MEESFLLTFVVHVALRGSTSLSNLCSTALGHRVESRASIRNVSIYMGVDGVEVQH